MVKMNKFSATIDTHNQLRATSDPIQIWPEMGFNPKMTKDKSSFRNVRKLNKKNGLSFIGLKRKIQALNSFDFRLKKLPLIYKYTLLSAITIAVFLGILSILNLVNRNTLHTNDTVISSDKVTPPPLFSKISAISDSVATPVRLKIPSIEVDALIEGVGITDQGTLGVPTDAANVGWYELGAKPGQKGTAIIDGHLDAADGSAGVFSKLHLLTPGDVIMVIDDNEKNIKFTVKSLKAYHAQDLAPEIFNQNDNGIRLNLITCEGIWDYNKATYSERLVVFTESTLNEQALSNFNEWTQTPNFKQVL